MFLRYKLESEGSGERDRHCELQSERKKVHIHAGCPEVNVSPPITDTNSNICMFLVKKNRQFSSFWGYNFYYGTLHTPAKKANISMVFPMVFFTKDAYVDIGDVLSDTLHRYIYIHI